MATGRSMQLTKQVGEYLVAAELCRRGLIATTFTGNVPHYDIIASNEAGKHLAIQVKAIRSGSWQLNLSRFVRIRLRGKRQMVGPLVEQPVHDLVFVFVMLKDYGADRFFILDWKDLQRLVVDGHRSYLKKHGGIRPKKPESLHTAVSRSQLDGYEDNWELIERRLGTKG